MKKEPVWLTDDTPVSHKLIRVVLFLTSFSWTFNPIQDYMGESSPVEKIFTRMLPMLMVAAYCVFCEHRHRLRSVLHPFSWPILWYVTFGVFSGISSVQPAMCAWKGAEILILLMWVTVSCHDADSTRREFVSIARLVEILLWVTVVLAILNPTLGLRRSPSMIPWLQGYLPIINPNQVGFLSVAAFVRLIFLPARAKPVRLLLVLSTLVCSQSRTSYAVSLVVLVIFIIDGLRERQYFRVSLASLAALAALLLTMGHYETLVRILMRGQSEESLESLSGRTDYWNFALNYATWFGGGLATGSRSLILVTGQETFLRGSVNLHNSFVEALLGAGYVGALPYLAMVVIHTLRQVIAALTRPSLSQGLFLVMALVFVARSMTSVVISLFSYDLMMLFIFWAWIRHDTPQAAPRRAQRPRPVVYDTPLCEMNRAQNPCQEGHSE